MSRSDLLPCMSFQQKELSWIQLAGTFQEGRLQGERTMTCVYFTGTDNEKGEEWSLAGAGFSTGRNVGVAYMSSWCVCDPYTPEKVRSRIFATQKADKLQQAARGKQGHLWVWEPWRFASPFLPQSLIRARGQQRTGEAAQRYIKSPLSMPRQNKGGGGKNHAFLSPLQAQSCKSDQQEKKTFHEWCYYKKENDESINSNWDDANNQSDQKVEKSAQDVIKGWGKYMQPSTAGGSEWRKRERSHVYTPLSWDCSRNGWQCSIKMVNKEISLRHAI